MNPAGKWVYAMSEAFIAQYFDRFYLYFYSNNKFLYLKILKILNPKYKKVYFMTYRVQLLYLPLKLKLTLINSIDICNKRQKLIEENY